MDKIDLIFYYAILGHLVAMLILFWVIVLGAV